MACFSNAMLVERARQSNADAAGMGPTGSKEGPVGFAAPRQLGSETRRQPGLREPGGPAKPMTRPPGLVQGDAAQAANPAYAKETGAGAGEREGEGVGAGEGARLRAGENEGAYRAVAASRGVAANRPVAASRSVAVCRPVTAGAGLSSAHHLYGDKLARSASLDRPQQSLADQITIGA